MATIPIDAVLRRLRQLTGADSGGVSTDRQLLQRFADHHDQAAFLQLVQRHGPMVLGVCRRWLGNCHDADDAFQATFLVLVRRAGALPWQDGIGPWLYQVAHRVVRKARTSAARRRTLEREVSAMPAETSTEEPAVDQQEVQQQLHEELDRLPAKYRAPLVLCYLQGKTHEEAAVELGWPRGSMARRLDRAQELLRDRLTGRGVTLASGVAVLLANEQAAFPAVSPSLLAATVENAALIDAGSPILSAAITSLMEGVLRAMYFSKLRLIVVAVLAVGLLAGGLGRLWSVSKAADPGPVGKAPPAAPVGGGGMPVLPWVTWSGPNSALADASYRRISSAGEWQTLWLAHRGKTLLESAGEVPQIDFRQCMVVAVFQGAGFNCRGVEAVSVTETAEAVTVRFSGQYYQTIGEGDAVRPFGVFLLPRSTKALVLEENVQNLLGQPPVWKLRAQFDALAALPNQLPQPADTRTEAERALTFDRDVLPILQAKCVKCHSDLRPKGKLDVGTVVRLQQGGANGPAVVAGDPAKSLLWQEIEAASMPPKGEPKLTAAEKLLVFQWIQNGARVGAASAKPADIRDRLTFITRSHDKNGDLPQKIREAATLLLSNEVEIKRRFTAPDVSNRPETVQFRNGLMNLQQNLGLIQFKMDTVLEELEQMQGDLKAESKAWQANYHYVVARLAAGIGQVYEFNAKLGELRKEFPEIDPRLHDGWQLVDGPRMEDRDGRKYQDRARRSFQQLVKDQPSGEWAAIAVAEQDALTGMAWKPLPRE